MRLTDKIHSEHVQVGKLGIRYFTGGHGDPVVVIHGGVGGADSWIGEAAELARRQFREIARVAGLVFSGYPGSHKSVRQVQASSGLLFDVFRQYDPDNLLLAQAQREVLERQLEQARLTSALRRIGNGKIDIVELDRPSPLAFPILVDRTREQVSSEKLADRIRRMTAALERGVAR